MRVVKVARVGLVERVAQAKAATTNPSIHGASARATFLGPVALEGLVVPVALAAAVQAVTAALQLAWLWSAHRRL